MTNLMHGTMMTQRKVMVGAKSGLHFKSMPKYNKGYIYTKYDLHEKVFTARLQFCIQRHVAPLEYIVLEDREIIQALHLGKPC